MWIAEFERFLEDKCDLEKFESDKRVFFSICTEFISFFYFQKQFYTGLSFFENSFYQRQQLYISDNIYFLGNYRLI